MRSMCRATRLSRASFIAVIAVLALMLTGRAGPAQAAAQYRFLQFNASGNVLYGGSLQAAVDIGNSILNLRPHVVTLNEVCRNQAEYLDSWLSGKGYPVQVTHTQTIPTFTTSKGIQCQYGNAVVSVGEQSQRLPASRVDLYSGGLEQRALTCLDVAVPVLVRACVTHLTNGSDASRSGIRTTQISQVAGATILRAPIAQGLPALVGGDMNVSPRGDYYHPDQLDPLYYWQGVGPLLEAEGTRIGCDPPVSPCSPTLGSKKFDYLFLDRTSWTGLSATTATALVSDHRLLKGYASH
jgi:endonuclease/exonuclease/phosphatase family metal-dependent hydrolase